MVLWYWQTSSEARDMLAMRSEIAKLDRGAPPGGAGAGDEPWRLRCALLLRRPNKQGGGAARAGGAPAGPSPAAARLFRVENPVAWPDEVVLVVPNATTAAGQQPNPGQAARSGSGAATGQAAAGASLMAHGGAHSGADGSGAPVANGVAPGGGPGLGPAAASSRGAARHAILQTSKVVGALPIFKDLSLRREVLVEGQEFVVGDFAIALGICRVSRLAYIVLKVRHLPCALPPTAKAFRDVADALGLGTRFPATQVASIEEDYADLLSEQYGPMHQALEAVQLFAALLNTQQQQQQQQHQHQQRLLPQPHGAHAALQQRRQ